MPIVGIVSKMVVKATTPIQYELPLGNEKIPLNEYLGKTISLKFTGNIVCLGCNKSIKKSYQDGYCFPCTQRLARCDFCILKPERCHFHLGTCREPDWGQKNCMIPHCVYLANASGLKVGITRLSQIPTRWIDQGAIAALPIVQVPTRRLSGLTEITIAKTVSDKTNWRKMLKGEIEAVDLYKERDRILSELSDSFLTLQKEWGVAAITFLPEALCQTFEFPVLEYPKQVKSLSWDKTPLIEGTLQGMKGQYLLFDVGVVNVRKHSGYILEANM
jgi:hypothetical protein